MLPSRKNPKWDFLSLARALQDVEKNAEFVLQSSTFMDENPFYIFKDFQSSIATVKNIIKDKANWKTTFAKHIWDKGMYL